MLVYFDLLEPEGEVEKELSMKKYIYIFMLYFGGDAKLKMTIKTMPLDTIRTH